MKAFFPFLLGIALISAHLIYFTQRKQPLHEIQGCARLTTFEKLPLLEECVRRKIPQLVQTSYEPLLLDWLLDARHTQRKQFPALLARLELLSAPHPSKDNQGPLNIFFAALIAFLGGGLLTSTPMRRLTSQRAQTHQRILVIDDDSDFAEGIADILRHGHYEVDRAACLKEAIQLVRQNNYDCVFCDYHLEHSLGTDLLALLFNDKEKRKCILISGDAEAKQIQHAHGYSGFIQKPCSSQEILGYAQKIAH